MMRLWRQHHAKDASTSAGLAPSMVLSLVAHAVVIVVAIAATANPRTEDRVLPENSIARFLAPPDRDPTEKMRPEMIRFVDITIPVVGAGKVLIPVDEMQPVRQLAHFDERDVAPTRELRGEDSVFSVVQVDSAAERYEWSAAPVYPPSMLAKNAQGLVRAEFIVSQEGYVDTLSVRVIESTDADFTRAVMDALPFMRFKPAKIGDAVVSQLVAQEFRFEITAVADTERKKPPQ